MNDDQILKTIAASKATMRAAYVAHRKLIMELFPVNSYVRWKEGPYIKAGLVQGYTLTGSNPRVNGKLVLVEAIILAMEEDA